MSKWNRLVRAIAIMLNCIKNKSFKNANVIDVVTSEKAKLLILQEAQKHLVNPLKDFKRQGVTRDEQGLWVIGRRSSLGDVQVLVPRKHPLALLLMQKAHKDARHTGRDSTLAMFRMEYYTSQGSKLAKSVRDRCTQCRILDKKTMTQLMGKVPQSSLKPAPVFNYTQLDLFGPWTTRGEVQKRISGKCWGVIFTCMASKAIHIEIISAYSTDAFLLGLSRFGSLRGWPKEIRSDPGSQLVSADKELRSFYNSMNNMEIQKKCSEHHTTWLFSPADAPHFQGATESLIRTVKRSVKVLYGHNQRLSFPEYATLGYTVADLINSRPIGVLGEAEDTITVLTPNALILGRNKSENPPSYIQKTSAPRLNEVNQIIQSFWKCWMKLAKPALCVQKKWDTEKRNLQNGDVVLVIDSDYSLEYKLAKVTKTATGKDNKVRSAQVMYKRYKVGELGTPRYSGSTPIEVSRSVNKLVLVAPVEESPVHSNDYA